MNPTVNTAIISTMNVTIQQALDTIFTEQKKSLEKNWQLESDVQLKHLEFKKIVQEKTSLMPSCEQVRIVQELEGWGPLEALKSDAEITEILVNSPSEIIYEKKGQLFFHDDHFYNEQTYNQCVEKISQACHGYMNKEIPFLEAQVDQMRITLIYKDIARGQHLISIRKQPQDAWTLDKLFAHGWCNDEQKQYLDNLLLHRKNFLVIGGTSSGKTSVLQALLNHIPQNQRVVSIEDTQELRIPNLLSTSLLTKTDPLNTQNDVTMNDLLKRALRLRPDRIAVGEIRGAEATNLLMALATGHEGSCGTLHSRTAHEALLRLEMLVQMGAPQWSLESIRRLIGLTVQNILVVQRKDGVRVLEGIYEISSVEQTGITLYKVV